jgi:hypothetical protein
MECVKFADHPAVPVRQSEDEGGRRQAADLQQDEDEIAAMERQRADEQAAQKPHRPGAAADPRRTVLPCQVHHLGQIRQHRDGDSGDPDQLKHLLAPLLGHR